MTDPDLKRIEELFQAAADLPEADRGDFLAEQCAGREDLHAQVRTLLGRLDGDDDWSPPGVELPGGPILEGPGSTIGRYKLLQVIGEGGFGVVYMAEQQRPIVRKVALKIIKLGMDTREVVARFEAERQALALMDHPNIARVLDGGATESGRPYFVMELVRGVSITEYTDANDLPPGERLELFRQVCHAVQHAHQKGVIHRDLKPSNVLVTLDDGRPIPKVIDFGVAKAMHTRLTEKTLFTRYEQFIGTPAYMSPEQAEMSALDVDTRTDIYSLGVLLYELLTGSTPFDTQSLLKAGIGEIQRVIREENPPRPSLRISTGGDAAIARRRQLDVQGLSRLLRGDLDWIVMKAMEKERGRRYATANELAEDIRRHLRNEPVLAGPPGAAYRVRKLLARNRTAVVSAMLVVLALVIGIVATTAAMMQSRRNARLAQQQAEHALAALEFLDTTLALTNPEVALSPDVTVRTLLDHTATRVSDAFADAPWAEARVRSTIGRAYSRLGEEALAEPHLRRAVELVDQQIAAAGGDVAPDDVGVDGADFYQTLWRLTNVCFNLQRPDAFAIAVRAREVGFRHVGRTHPELADALETFVAEVQGGAWVLQPEAMAEVPALFERARGLADAALSSGDPHWPIVADTYLTGGYILWYTPHEPIAETFWREALAIQQRELPPDHPDIAASVNLIVGVLNRQDKAGEAEVLIRESLAALRRVHRADAMPIAALESTLGETLVHRRRFDEAETLLLRSHATLLEILADPTHWMVAESSGRVIKLYEAWDRPDEVRDYRDVLARTCAVGSHVSSWLFVRPILGPEHAALRDALDDLKAHCGGVSYLITEGSAVPDADLVPILESILPLEGPLGDDEMRAMAIARLLLGWAHALDPETQARPRTMMAEEALRVLGPRAEELPVTVACALAMVSTETEDRAEARRQLREAWGLIRDRAASEMWFTVALEIRVARAMLAEGMHTEAETILRPGLEAMRTQLGPTHPDSLEAQRLVHELYVAMGRDDEAKRYAVDG